jgi:hypothetical protein
LIRFMHQWTCHLMQRSLLMVTQFCSLNMPMQTFSITGSIVDWRQHPFMPLCYIKSSRIDSVGRQCDKKCNCMRIGELR